MLPSEKIETLSAPAPRTLRLFIEAWVNTQAPYMRSQNLLTIVVSTAQLVRLTLILRMTLFLSAMMVVDWSQTA